MLSSDSMNSFPRPGTIFSFSDKKKGEDTEVTPTPPDPVHPWLRRWSLLLGMGPAEGCRTTGLLSTSFSCFPSLIHSSNVSALLLIHFLLSQVRIKPCFLSSPSKVHLLPHPLFLWFTCRVAGHTHPQAVFPENNNLPRNLCNPSQDSGSYLVAGACSVQL